MLQEPPSKAPRITVAKEVVVLGGGIAGLTTAIRLLEAGCLVTVVAKSFEDTCSHSAASWFTCWVIVDSGACLWIGARKA